MTKGRLVDLHLRSRGSVRAPRVTDEYHPPQATNSIKSQEGATLHSAISGKCRVESSTTADLLLLTSTNHLPRAMLGHLRRHESYPWFTQTQATHKSTPKNMRNKCPNNVIPPTLNPFAQHLPARRVYISPRKPFRIAKELYFCLLKPLFPGGKKILQNI